MASASRQPISPLLHLPPELTESILIYSTVLGCPTAVAFVAQTCRTMRQLVYEAPDSHLWRELFLSIFDDPRPVLKVNNARSEPRDNTHDGADGEAKLDTEGVRDEEVEAFDWSGEFQARVWAINYIRRQSSAKANSPVTLTQTEYNTTALATISRMIETAKISPPLVFLALSPHDEQKTGLGYVPLPWGHTFPPMPSQYISPSKEASTSEALPSSKSDLYESDTNSSANIRWLEKLMAGGLPADLVTKLSGEQLYGGKQGTWDSQTQAREFRAFCKVICCTGFVPTPQPGEAKATEPETSPAPPSADDDDSLLFSYSPPPSSEPESEKELSMSTEAQRMRARRLARMRVYNLTYTKSARHWGPYLLPAHLDNPSSEVKVDRNFFGPMADFLFAHLGHHVLNHGLVLEDHFLEEWGGFVNNNLGQHAAENDGDGESEGEGEHEHGAGDDGEEEWENQDDGPVPNYAELVPDWTYLAAARIVVEENLREFIQQTHLAGLFSLNGLRRDSIPRVVGPDGIDRPISRPPVEVAGGWDWAGVTGAWRRCVCWMDYGRLLQENATQMAHSFSASALREANRIVPTVIRIESYSPCPIPKYRHRPDIHVVADVSSQDGEGSPRKMKGTIGMLADGSIRWSMYSLVDGEEMAEWASEGIQIGQPRSGIGILGMWTGAQHERLDPLGPFWMWKVG